MTLDPEEVRQALCAHFRGLAVVEEHEGCVSVALPITRSNGDYVEVFLRCSGQGVEVSDLGLAWSELEMQGGTVSGRARQVLDSVLTARGLQLDEDDRSASKCVQRKQLAWAVLDVAVAVVAIDLAAASLRRVGQAEGVGE